MKLVVRLEIQDEEGNVIVKDTGQVPNIRAMSTITVVSLIRQWVAETYCKLSVDAIGKEK